MERTKNIDTFQIYKLWNEYAAAATEGDLELWLSLWIEDGLQLPPGAPRRIGKEQIQAAIQSTFDLFIIHNMTINTEEVRILGDWAYSHGTYEFEITPKTGGETTRKTGKFLDILEKQIDGSWKIAIDCHNFNTLSN